MVLSNRWGLLWSVLIHPFLRIRRRSENKLPLFCTQFKHQIKTFSCTSSGVQFLYQPYWSPRRVQPHRYSFLKHKTSLRHRTFKGINQQKNSISHIEHALYFTTEIAWPGVSMILILWSLYWTETFLDTMVIPRSRSRSLLSSMSSPLFSFSLKSWHGIRFCPPGWFFRGQRER